MYSLKERIKRRLESYLELDIDGIRKFIFDILLRLKKVTVERLHKELTQRFTLSFSAVASTIGYIHSRIGILHAYKESYKTPIVYSLKEEYVDLLKNALRKRVTNTA